MGLRAWRPNLRTVGEAHQGGLGCKARRDYSVEAAKTAVNSIEIEAMQKAGLFEAISLQMLEARVRIELTHKGFADLSLTTWVPRP